MPTFSTKVITIVAKIPKGKVMSYAQVAKKAGSPRAARAVGSCLNRNFRGFNLQLKKITCPKIPCHRVIRSNGEIGGFALGQKAKEKILRTEGHSIVKHKINLLSPVWVKK